MSNKASSDCNQDNQQSSHETVSYRDAGVDIDAGNSLVDRIKPLVASTMRPEVMAGVGGFGALVGIDLQRYREPVLVSGTDGVGTKLLLARQLQKHNSIGIDLVAMCVNDILVQGAEPLFFLDYFACGQLSVEQAADVVSGIAAGCRQAGCALVGGETAEMPGMYGAGDYDLAGFVVGIADKAKIIDGTQVQAGHHIIGLASSGPHSNGYSLIRRMLETRQSSLDQRLHDIEGLRSTGSQTVEECAEELNQTLGEALLAPTRIYAQLIHALLEEHPIAAMAHITGGGLLENINRSIPDGLVVQLKSDAWPRPAVFRWLQGEYRDASPRIDATEMLRTFNCGIGFVLVVAAEHSQAVLDDLAQRGEKAWQIGQVLDAADANDAATVVLS